MDIFSLDLGNKQTKLKSSKAEYVLPSRYLNQADMPMSVGNSTMNNDLHTYSVPFSDDKYVWGRDIDGLHLDEYLADTIMYGARYDSEAFKLLANFALGLLASDFKAAKDQVLEVVVTAGLPTGDYADQGQLKALLKVLEGQHQVTIDDKIVTVRVRKVYILPQPIGTLYNELLDDEGFIQNKDLLDEKVGIVDVGGGTILIDTILNFELSGKNRHQFNTGVNDLYEAIANGINGDTSLYQLEKDLRKGNQQHHWSYRFSKNRQDDITDLVCKEIDRFTRRLVANVTSTLKNLNSIDTLFFTGGGANLLNQKILNTTFTNAVIVKNTEVANVNGFYKYGLSQQAQNEGSK
ncbi:MULTISPECIES: ParM/StbA family protein [Lactobacillaceae]|uniref:ParM/StbA family protein n=1 Tax=Lactobacillaceae TaxID=33958 RepID=UPI0021C2DEC1|nr:ParM/StbA family protein [Lacticaseibacillus paracasei]MCP9305827.1 ParM/StbA family protein [Lacticaseibacillus paracasei]MDN5576290.1 ParM/StbA family protein [Pediococcus sp.]